MQQLKAALIKAGLVSKEKPKEGKELPKKSASPQKESKKYHEHHMRTECEFCNNPSPDVEYYKHNNRLIIKRWLCIKCADEYKIDDNLRDTHQSSYAKTGRFRRMWGKTKEFR